MDIATLSTQMSMDQTGTAVGLAVTKMAMDVGQQSNEQMIDMIQGMELSVNPNLGANINIRI